MNIFPPEHIQMFIALWKVNFLATTRGCHAHLQRNRSAVSGQLPQHELDIDEAVGVTVKHDDWAGDILCREASGAV